jgi:hypothetical protein
MIALALLGAAAWGCDEVVTADALMDDTDAAREAFLAMDAGGFSAAMEALEGGVPCLEEALSPAQAAQVHIASALAGFLARDEQVTIAAFQAARAADPTLDLSRWVPASHPVTMEFRLAERLDQEPPTALDTAAEVTLWIDGVPGEALVLTRPSVLQLERAGQIVDSALWTPGPPLPEWAPLAPERIPPEIRRRLWLGGSAAVATAGSAALFILSSGAHTRFLDPSTPYEELDELERAADLTSAFGIGAGAVAGGLATALVLRW